MKNMKLVTIIGIAAAISLTSCKSNSSGKESTPDTTIAEEMAPQEIELGNDRLTFTSKYEFEKNDKMSEQINLSSPKVIEAAYYNLNISKSIGTAGLNYQYLTVYPSMDGAVNGLINGYEGVKGITITEKNIDDVSAEIGLPSKLGYGKMTINTTEDGISIGEFCFLVVQKDKKLLLFQGIFQKEGTQQAVDFMNLLQTVRFVDK